MMSYIFTEHITGAVQFQEFFGNSKLVKGLSICYNKVMFRGRVTLYFKFIYSDKNVLDMVLVFLSNKNNSRYECYIMVISDN